MRRLLPLAVAAALVLAVPAVASADTHFVAITGTDAGDCTAPGSPCRTIMYAVGQAVNGDTIEIGSGEFIGTVGTGKVLSFRGVDDPSLEETTVLGTEAPGSAGGPAFSLPAGGRISFLEARGGDGADGSGMIPIGQPGGSGISYPTPGGSSLEIESVDATGGAGGSGILPASGGAGIEADSGGDASLFADTSTFASGPGFSSVGALIRGASMKAELSETAMGPLGAIPLSTGLGIEEAEVKVRSCYLAGALQAAVLSGGSLELRNCFLVAEGDALRVTPSVGNVSATAAVYDSILTAIHGPAAEVETDSSGGSASAELLVQASDLLSDQAPGLIARGGTDGPASAVVRNTIAFNEEGPGPDLAAENADIDALFSNYSEVEVVGGSVQTPGVGTNVAGDPQLDGFVPEPGSPLVDAGDPGLVAPGELDIEGSPRSLDGDGDCVAKPDIGAAELTGHGVACPPAQQPTPAASDPAPVVSAFGMTNRKLRPAGGKGSKKAAGSAKAKGTKFTYSLSEPARVSIVIERKQVRKGKKPRWVRVITLTGQERDGRQDTPFSGKVRGKFLKPGTYRARITATDSAGQASAPKQTGFTVLGG